MRIHRKLSGILLAAGVLVPVAVSEARADQLVTFVRGQSIVARTIEKRGSWYFFTLEGGGEMGVPASVVARIEAYEAPPAAPAAAAPVAPSTPPGPSSAPPPVPQAMTVQTDPSAAQAVPAASKGMPPNSEAAANGAPGDENWRFQGRIPAGSRVRPGMRLGGAERQIPMGAAGRLLGGVTPPGGQGRRVPPPPDPPQ